MALDRPEEKSVSRGQAIGPDFFSAGKLKSADIRNFVIKCFDNNQYEQLEKELSDRGFLESEKIERFFIKEGDVILSQALRTRNDQPLKFLAAENSIVPKKILKDVLRNYDFSTLRTFLYGQAGLESIQKYTPELAELQIKKFKILLSIDQEGVKDFMQKNIDNKYLQTENIKQNFAKAERQFEADNSFSNVITRPPADF